MVNFLRPYGSIQFQRNRCKRCHSFLRPSTTGRCVDKDHGQVIHLVRRTGAALMGAMPSEMVVAEGEYWLYQ